MWRNVTFTMGMGKDIKAEATWSKPRKYQPNNNLWLQNAEGETLPPLIASWRKWTWRESYLWGWSWVLLAQEAWLSCWELWSRWPWLRSCFLLCSVWPTRLMSVSGCRLTPDHQNNWLQLCDGEVVLSAPKSISQKNKKNVKNKQKIFN